MDWLQVVLAPILMVVGGIITWFFKSRNEERRAVEERLHAEHRRVYGEILAPYVKLFAGISRGDAGANQIGKEITSDEYRKAIFELGLLGSDEVVRAYNELMQYFFKLGTSEKQDMHVTVRLWGKLRLEIRKSLGNKKTKLNEFDMLRGEITDIDKLGRPDS